MSTRTIFEEYTECAYRIGAGGWQNDADSGQAVQQLRTLRAELLRRMDERDADARKAKAWDAFVAWATDPYDLKYSREREWGDWMDMFTGYVGYAFPDVWPLAKPPYVRPQWYADQEAK
jgi:hypothetical protein